MKILLLMLLPLMSFSQNFDLLKGKDVLMMYSTSELQIQADTTYGKVVYLSGFDLKVEKGYEIQKLEGMELIYAYFLSPNRPLKARDVVYFRPD